MRLFSARVSKHDKGAFLTAVDRVADAAALKVARGVHVMRIKFSFGTHKRANRSLDRQGQPWDQRRLVHARNFAQDCCAVDFARRCRGVVPTIDVKICAAKDGAVQVRAGREFENVVVPDAGIG
jgi:hypothetical protein